MSFPALVLVPGLWEGTAAYDPLREVLAKHGFMDVYTAGLRSTGQTSPNNPTMLDDIAGIRTVIEPLVKAGKRVVVVAHSAGGFLASAATENLEAGHTNSVGGVEKFFYIAAGLSPTGTEHKPLPFMDFQGNKMFCKNPDILLFNDVPADVRAKYEPLVTYQPGCGWDGVIPYHGWDKIPSMYIVADKDECLPPALQEKMAILAGCKTEHVPLGHLAILSGPELIAEKLMAFLNS